MGNFSRVIVAGNLVRDPEIHYVQSGSPLTARTPYAASAPPAFPALRATNAGTPKCFATVTATDMPRDLTEPVGFCASSLTRARLKAE